WLLPWLPARYSGQCFFHGQQHLRLATVPFWFSFKYLFLLGVCFFNSLFRGLDEFIGQNEAGLSDIRQFQMMFGPIDHYSDISLLVAEDGAAISFLAFLRRLIKLDLGFESLEAVEIFVPDQGAVDTGRADLQRIGARDRVFDFQQG